jgi:hypothetical protein
MLACLDWPVNKLVVAERTLDGTGTTDREVEGWQQGFVRWAVEYPRLV